MPKKFDRVRPGDLITDIFINALLEYLEELDVRVTNLEQASGNVVITSIPPGTIRVGQEVHLRGRNFGFSTSTQKVFIDETAINLFKLGSDDTELIFDIPDIPNIPDTGKVVVLTVQNQNSTDSRTFLLLPAIQGIVTVTWVGIVPEAPQPIQANQSVTFQFSITPHSPSATFLITPTISGQDWNNLLQVLDDLKRVISSKQLPLVSEQTKTFYVQFTIPGNASTGTTFGLTVGASAGSVTGSSGTISGLTVGQPFPGPGKSIKQLSFDDTTFIPSCADCHADKTSNTIWLRQNISATALVTAKFTVAGTYVPSLSSPAQGWTAGFIPGSPGSDPNNPILVTSQQVTNDQPTQLQIVFKAAQGASSSTAITLSLQKQGQTTETRTVPFTLNVLS